MADVEAVDGLHQAADGFLKQVGIAEGVMAEALGDVGGQADVGGGQPMLEMDVAIVQCGGPPDVAEPFSSQKSRMNWAIGQGSRGGRCGADAGSDGSAPGPARSCSPKSW